MRLMLRGLRGFGECLEIRAEMSIIALDAWVGTPWDCFVNNENEYKRHHSWSWGPERQIYGCSFPVHVGKRPMY